MSYVTPNIVSKRIPDISWLNLVTYTQEDVSTSTKAEGKDHGRNR